MTLTPEQLALFGVATLAMAAAPGPLVAAVAARAAAPGSGAAIAIH